jgi:amino acid transporter
LSITVHSPSYLIFRDMISSKDDSRGTHSLIQNVDSSHGSWMGLPYNEDSVNNTSGKKSVLRRLTLIDGVAIVVGIIIGSGIFSSPGLALERCGSPGLDLICWAFSGILVMLSAQCYLELGGMMPSAGGDFDYLIRAYGDRVAFTFAWFNIFVSKTGSQAIIATIFGRYFESVILGTASDLASLDGNQNESMTSKGLAIMLIVIITLINCAGVKESALVSLLLTIIKVALVISVFIFAIIYASYSHHNAENFLYNLSTKSSFNGSKSIVGFGSAMIACLWCFDGFADGNFLQEEMIHPQRDLPPLIKIGLTIVTICYLLINVGYLSVLSRDTIIDSHAIAVEFGNTFSTIFASKYREILPTFLALGVSLSTMGSLNGSIMTGGRAFYAVARAQKFPAIMAKLNRFGAPYIALIVQGIWSIVLLLLPGSNFSTLLDYFGPTSWIFYALSASCVIILRYKEPETPRPFAVIWYPLPPLLVIFIACIIFVSSMMSEPLYTLLAIGFVILAFPVHLLMEYYEFYYGTEEILANNNNNHNSSHPTAGRSRGSGHSSGLSHNTSGGSHLASNNTSSHHVMVFEDFIGSSNENSQSHHHSHIVHRISEDDDLEEDEGGSGKVRRGEGKTGSNSNNSTGRFYSPVSAQEFNSPQNQSPTTSKSNSRHSAQQITNTSSISSPFFSQTIHNTKSTIE